MLKALCVSIALLLLTSCSLLHTEQRPCAAGWYGAIDSSFSDKVRADLASAQAASCKKLTVDLSSPGGSVFESLEAVHAIQKAEHAGLIVEIHGGSIVASGATFVLAAGSKGFRYARANSLGLVHGIQQMSMVGASCVGYTPDPQSDSEKAINRLIEMLAVEYSQLSGRSIEVTATWLLCDHTQVGGGELLVDLGLADHVEA